MCMCEIRSKQRIIPHFDGLLIQWLLEVGAVDEGLIVSVGFGVYVPMMVIGSIMRQEVSYYNMLSLCR